MSCPWLRGVPRWLGGVLCLALLSSCAGVGQGRSREPLPSWGETANKAALLEFIEEVSTPGRAGFVPVEERVAVFDNDGTLWAEQPFYFQLAFALDRLHELAPQHPEWRDDPGFSALLAEDPVAALAGGGDSLFELVMATHTGMTRSEFDREVCEWVATARHPETGLRYTEMVYQPMLELLEHLRDAGFRTYIVSGGGVDFMRGFAQEVYGVPPEQVIGSRVAFEYVSDEAGARLERLAELDFIDDKEGKPVGIARRIGRRPVLAVGNSDGDFQMLEWTTAGDGPRLGVLVHHDDPEREWAYDRDSHIGHLERGLDEGPSRGWLIVGMREDWRRVFPRDDSEPREPDLDTQP